ncbi:MAG: hypothetical protein KatS3mg091_291 [Patescibacteria group bacterium]|nr:MAG: hypothetical protein KatS3mg091_291 [Patescibacteria group bacterium]
MLKTSSLQLKKSINLFDRPNESLTVTKPKKINFDYKAIKYYITFSLRIINDYFNPAVEGNPYEKL